MQEILADAAGELVSVVVFSAVASVLTAAGVLTERAGLANLATGQTAVGLWYVYMGGLALFVGLYLLGYREVWPRLRGLWHSAEGRHG